MIACCQTPVVDSLHREALSVVLCEGEYVAKNLITAEEKTQAYHLRHETFARELRWVAETDNSLETDAYDTHAIPFGIIDPFDQVIAHMRIITADHSYMLEREFRKLAGNDHDIRKEPDTAELTRCCVAANARNRIISTAFGDFDLFSYLLKGIYCWCRSNRIRYLYAVTDHRVYKLVQIKGLPFRAIAPAHTMPDGVIAVAILLDWQEFENTAPTRRRNLLPWFTQNRGV